MMTFIFFDAQSCVRISNWSVECEKGEDRSMLLTGVFFMRTMSVKLNLIITGLTFFHLMLSVKSFANTDQTETLALLLEREPDIVQIQKDTLIPWFERGIISFIEATPHLNKTPVKIRTIRFMHPKPIGNITIVHGYRERFEKYIEQTYDFYQRGYNVFLYDQRGHGESDRLTEDTGKTHVDAFEQYVLDLKLIQDKLVEPNSSDQNKFIFSHSMGGLVTLHFLRSYPNMVQAAVLSSPMTSIKTAPLSKSVAYYMTSSVTALGYGDAYLFGQKPPSAGYWKFEKAGTSCYNRWKAYSDLMLAEKFRKQATGGSTFGWIADALQGTFDLQDPSFLPAIQTPTLLFQGKKDTWIDISNQEQVCSNITSCDFTSYDNGKHELFMETDQIRIPYLQQIFKFFEVPRAVQVH
ncbi:MAG: hypothetical protein CMP10_17480 [Zetaproteobacteria bacterium]|nr:hypothetical protein [Pseudobdellovibrionaceae bacterium]